jgi:hypothetical protein
MIVALRQPRLALLVLLHHLMRLLNARLFAGLSEVFLQQLVVFGRQDSIQKS